MPATTNQINMTGPNMPPMKEVPFRWIENSTARMTTVAGTTKCASCGAIDLESFDCAKHRNRRRDRAVAIEQSGADEADHDQAARQVFAWRAAG